MTCGPAADAPGLEAPVLDLLLEQPAPAATTKATPATPTTIPCFTTALLWVAGVATFSSWPRQTRANATGLTYAVPQDTRSRGSKTWSSSRENAQAPPTQERI